MGQGVQPQPPETSSPQRDWFRAWGEPVGAGGPSRPETRPRVGSQPGGNAPAPRAAGAGNPIASSEARPKAKPKPAARPATRGERVSRAWSGARKRRTEGVGRPVFRGHGRRPDARIAGRASSPGKGHAAPWPRRGRSYPLFAHCRRGRRI